jgi:acyl-CoA reductase-like NAD-dependent aldehyde dehydrogenase
MRGPELADPAERHALLADLVEELQDREPELLVLIRKMGEMIDEAEGELEREIDTLRDVIADLEKELAEARNE